MPSPSPVIKRFAAIASVAALASAGVAVRADAAALPQRQVKLALELTVPESGHTAAAFLRAQSAARRTLLTSRLASLGLHSVGNDGFTLTVSGSRPTVDAEFGTAAADGSLTLPSSLAGLVSSAVDPAVTGITWQRHGVLVPADISPLANTPAKLDTDYGLGTPSTTPPTNPASGPIVATVQFSGWDSSDLTTYAANMGVYSSAYDPVASGQYSAVGVDRATYDPYLDDPDISSEVALDQEAILGAAPQLRQRAYIALNRSDGFLAAYDAVLNDVVNNHLPITVLSTSWGACELKTNRLSLMTALEQRLAALASVGVTVVAASGDSGRYDCSQDQPGGADNSDAVDFPASSPYVVGVGGTSHISGRQDSVYDEPGGAVYDPAFRGNGSGGGMSKVFLRPVWQAALTQGGGNRLVPDVAEDAAVVTGITIWHGGKSFTVGGTSLSAPLFAAQLAVVEARHTGGAGTGLGDIHPQLYRAAGTFSDVLASAPRSISVVNPILPGYDGATGLGTPNWNLLEGALYSPAPATGGAPTARAAASTVNGIVRPNLRPVGVPAVRWYVSYGHDAGCWGGGTAKAPGTLVPGEGAVRVFVHTATTGLVCSPVRSFVVTSPVDERHARKQGPWKGAKAASAYRKTLLESAKAGATLSYTGTGRHFAALVTTGPGFGKVQILLDGKVVGTKDLGTGKRRFEVLVPATARKSGRHTVAIRVLGQAGAGKQPLVAVDGFLAAP